MTRGTRPQVISAIFGVMLALGGVAGGCGDSGSGESPTTSPTAPAMSSATSGSSATPFTQATTAAPSPTAASGLVENGGASAGTPAWQVTGDETSAGSTVVTQFLDAVNAKNLASASNLLAPDAAFQLEDVTNRVRRITLAKPILLVPDEEGPAHLAMMGRGTAGVVAVQGSDLESATYDVRIGLRRESRRDEWRVWSFDLQPL